jgi:dihydroorotate dehydrogenase electron transfer subunit
MKKRIEDLTVIENRRLNNEFFVLSLTSTVQIPEILPGQFAEVRIDNSPETFLRRPFSIYNADYSKNIIELLVKIAGRGTEVLSVIRPGSALNMIYPLGNSFSLPETPNVLLIGGGTGVAPLLLLGKYLREKGGITPKFLFGYRNAGLIVELDRFRELGDVMIATNDGSFGEKGLVVEHSEFTDNLKNYDTIYACGPEIMMKAVARSAVRNNIKCEVSLENLMGCGFGACLCCIVDTKDRGNINTCTEGPVFNINNLKWPI